MSILQCLQAVDEVPEILLPPYFDSLESTINWLNANHLPLLYLQEVNEYARNKLSFIEERHKIENNEKMIKEYDQKDLLDVINSYFQTHYKYKISAVLIQTNRNEFQRIR